MDQAAWQQLRQAATSVPWRMVSAAGVEQAVACIGQGEPTVVYLNGFGSPAAPSWSQAAVAQSEANRVCMFDRPGKGLSPARAGPPAYITSENPMPGWAPERHALEMLVMLQVLGEPGPFLLTGWSYGGLVARTAAALDPEEVAGLVLVVHRTAPTGIAARKHHRRRPRHGQPTRHRPSCRANRVVAGWPAIRRCS